MVRTPNVRWAPLAAANYIAENRRAADVIWIGRTILGVPVASDFDLSSLINILGLKTKSLQYSKPKDLIQLLMSCYTVRYKDGKRWQDERAKNYSLIEWIRSGDYKRDPKVIPLELVDGKLSEDIITTAYHTKKRKRILISGLHRAAALLQRAKEAEATIPSVRVYECSGAKIDQIFPCDLCHF